MTSPDGVNWTQRTGGDYRYYSIAYGNGTFVITRDFGKVVTSTNGLDWTLRDWDINGHGYGVNYGNGQFVAVGILGMMATSSDGSTWTDRTV